MQARLIIKNFGPLRDIDVELRNVNVLIGAQASGKSALAKLYTICKSPLAFINKPANPLAIMEPGNKNGAEKNFKTTLEEYNILTFLEANTFIEFDSPVHYFKYENETISYKRKLLDEIATLEKLWTPEQNNRQQIGEMLWDFREKLFHFFIFFNSFTSERIKEPHNYSKEKFIHSLITSNYTEDQITGIIGNIKSIEENLQSNTALYIPAERNFVPIIKGASLSLQKNNVPIPKHILSFAAEYEKAAFSVTEMDLSFVGQGLKYINEGGIDQIQIDIDTKIKLTQAASGLQSIVPLLLPILNQKKLDENEHKSFVIEEPELNLFPLTQYELVKMLEQGRKNPFSGTEDYGIIHTYTTHSPFILSAFNNLLFASKVQAIIAKQLNKTVSKEKPDPYLIAWTKIRKIVPVFISLDNFSAYQLANGKAESIVENGLIKENFIDQTSDKLGEDFEALMDLLDQYK